MLATNSMNAFLEKDVCDRFAYSISGAITFGTESYLDRTFGDTPCCLLNIIKNFTNEVVNLISLPLAAVETVVRSLLALIALACSTNEILLNSWSFSLSTLGHNVLKLAFPVILTIIGIVTFMCTYGAFGGIAHEYIDF